MIYINRTMAEPPAILVTPGKGGLLERENAIAFFMAPERVKEFLFSAYRQAEVKRKLLDLCHRKCAYCESKETGSDYDVEHFRPKGMITKNGKKIEVTGYYWLAADWDNLFISCQHCNQSRVQDFPGATAATSGKKNEFPLSDDSKRAKCAADSLAKEEKYRLLLDPSKDRPEEHLVFTVKEFTEVENGVPMTKTYMLMDSRMQDDNKLSLKGETSLLVFGLNRKILAEERHREYVSLQCMMDSIIEYAELIEDPSNANKPAKLEKWSRLMKEALTELYKRRGPDERFSAMAIFFTDPFLEKYKLPTSGSAP